MSSTKPEDVEMKDSNAPVEEDPEVKKRRAAKEAFDLQVSDMVHNIVLLNKGIQQNDDRLISRAIRQCFHMRKKFTRQLLEAFVSKVLAESDRKDVVMNLLSKVKEDAMDIDTTTEATATATTPSDQQPAQTPSSEAETPSADAKKKQPLSTPEAEVLLQTLAVVFLIDKKNIQEAVTGATDLLNYLHTFNRRTMNQIGARVYFFYARSFELNNDLASIRTVLLTALRTASLRHDNSGQAVLINLLLRNYIADNLYDQANKLISKTPNMDIRSGSQAARFFYYKGRIKSIQLDYSDAYECFMTAIRKAPSSTAFGFRLSAQKFAVIVKLLMGEIPERNVFTQKGFTKALKPYFELTKYVRIGDLAQFKDCVAQYSDVYKRDKTYTLIQRIRQNVIRTGLKKISLSYSRISFDDICAKLHLDTPEDAECIVTKAIKDGIIDAVIDHERRFVQSRENIEVYNTTEPTEAFHKRTTFCLKLHDDCVQAMRFPPDAYKRTKKEFEGADDSRVQAEELAQELMDEADEEDW
jgi:26S proteasome regulatory subunit N3